MRIWRVWGCRVSGFRVSGLGICLGFGGHGVGIAILFHVACSSKPSGDGRKVASMLGLRLLQQARTIVGVRNPKAPCSFIVETYGLKYLHREPFKA